jgi:hypothetical protein
MITLLIVIIFVLGLIAIARIIYVGAWMAIPAFLIIFTGFFLINPWAVIIICLIFIILFGKTAKKEKEYWM